MKEYFYIKKSRSGCATTRKFFTFKKFMFFLNYAVAFYNIVLVPLEFAFRIENYGGLMAVNIFTLVFYLVDIFMRGFNIRKAKLVN